MISTKGITYSSTKSFSLLSENMLVDELKKVLDLISSIEVMSILMEDVKSDFNKKIFEYEEASGFFVQSIIGNNYRVNYHSKNGLISVYIDLNDNVESAILESFLDQYRFKHKIMKVVNANKYIIEDIDIDKIEHLPKLFDSFKLK